jgi:hypothetical protein
MAHVWRKEKIGWVPTGLDRLASGLPTLFRSTEGSFGNVWLLAAPSHEAVAVNGEPVRAGLVALRDRDEIRLADGERLFFSTQDGATVEPFAGSSTDLRCPRCRRSFEVGSMIVRCPGPGCGVIHHQTDDLPCWTYTEWCAVCPQSTELGEEHRWTPEEL